MSCLFGGRFNVFLLNRRTVADGGRTSASLTCRPTRPVDSSLSNLHDVHKRGSRGYPIIRIVRYLHNTFERQRAMKLWLYLRHDHTMRNVSKPFEYSLAGAARPGCWRPRADLGRSQAPPLASLVRHRALAPISGHKKGARRKEEMTSQNCLSL